MTDLTHWSQLSSDLGLQIAMVSERSMVGWSFASVRRELAEPAMPEPKTTPWLHGERGGISVIAAPVWLASWTHIHQPYDGTLMDTAMPPAPYTLAMAEIDPPLFAGVRMVNRDSPRFGPPVPEALVRFGNPTLDTMFWTYAFDVDRLHRIFAPQHAGDDFAQAIAAAAKMAIVSIQDGVVEVMTPGHGYAPRRLEGQLDVATTIARELSLRSSTLPERAGEAPAKRQWAELVAARGLGFDSHRWHAFGRVSGVAVEVLLESAADGVHTTVRAMFRASLGCGLYVKRGRRPPLFGVFWRAEGLELGNEEWDRVFRLEAFEAIRARELMLNPVARAALLHLARDVSELVLNDAEVLVAAEGVVPPSRLGEMIDGLVAVVDVLTPPLPAAGPFR
ncbi:MAG: hypothetical protein JWO86_5277 [Myxococcaceae bacterium]|nr:hypothetical protein [Myxococcaceae bacterium]